MVARGLIESAMIYTNAAWSVNISQAKKEVI